MSPLALCLLISAQDAVPSRLPTLLEPGDRAVVFPISPRFRASAPWAEVVAVTRWQTVRCFQWDSDWMVPGHPAQESEIENADNTRNIANLLNDSNGQSQLERLLHGESIRASELSPERRTKIKEAARKVVSWVDFSADDTDFSLSLGAQTDLLIRSNNSVFQFNLRNCTNAASRLRQIFGTSLDSNPDRCPPELLRDVRSSFSIPLDGTIQTRPLAAIVSKLAAGSARPLYVDTRIQNMKLATFGRTGRLSAIDLLRVLPESLDLYWRRVGESWLLAASPGDPFAESRRRVTRRSNQDIAGLAKGLFRTSDATGLNEVEIWLNQSRRIGDLTNQQLSVLDQLISECGNLLNRNGWDAMRQNGLNPESTVGFSIIMSPTISLNGSSFGWTLSSAP